MKSKCLQFKNYSFGIKGILIAAIMLCCTTHVKAYYLEVSGWGFNVDNTMRTDGTWQATVVRAPVGTNIAIPNTVYGKDYDFNNNGLYHTWTVTGVAISDGSTKEAKESWVNVSIPNTVVEISAGAFLNCINLKTISIPSSVIIIKADCFKNCTSLETILLPSSVKEIGVRAYENCTALTQIDMSVNMPGVTTVGQAAFRGCTALKSFTISEIVSSLASIIFNGCTALQTVNFNAIQLNFAGVSLFLDCPSLTHAVIGSQVQFIPQGLFQNTSITTATISEGVKDIRASAFENCPNLAMVNIPASVDTVGRYAFRASGVKSINIQNRFIGVSMFENCTALTEVTIPTSVTVVNHQSFKGCKALRKANILNSILAMSQFQDCTALQEVSLSNTIREIDSYVFQNCTSLREVKLPDSLVSIAWLAFANTALEEITIPAGVTVVSAPFTNCVNLRKAVVLNKVINTSCFANLAGLQKVYISENVETIYISSFSACTGLKEITVKWKKPLSLPLFTAEYELSNNVFYNVNQSNVTLKVPRGTLTAYKAAPVWKNFKIEEDIELSTAPTSTSALVSWYAVPNATGYKLEIFTDKDRTQLFNTYNLTTEGKLFTKTEEEKLSCMVQGLSPQTTYYYTLIALGENSTLLGEYTGDFMTSNEFDPIFVTGITLNKHELLLKIDSTETLTATITPADATNKAITWTSRNTNIATVDNTGKIIAKAEGSTYIVATTQDGGFKDSCLVTVAETVNIPVTGITLNKHELLLKTDSTETLTATVLPENATNKAITWTSRNTNIATVDNTGKIIAKAEGSTYIVATTQESGFKDSCLVNVSRETGINPVEALHATPLRVYPNPTSSQLIISPLTPKGGISTMPVEIYDVMGKLVAVFSLPFGEVGGACIDISHLPNGVYMLKVGKERTKIIKN